MSKATAREEASRLVRDSHWGWFDQMSLKDKLIFLLYSARFGVEGDHMSATARQSCSLDADAFLAALRAAGLVVVPVEPTEQMAMAFHEAQWRAPQDRTYLRRLEDFAGRYKAMIAASQEDKG